MQKMELCDILSKFGSRPGLARISAILKRLSNPEKKLKIILVTGTNGKGSVTSYLASILKEAGYKTGSYFSPHLINYNERFKINGKNITDSKLKKYEKLILDLFKEEKYEMTEFEALTAIAYKYFADENCDFAVMEIGMGGRLDATNIAEECIGIITHINLDHTNHLGATVEQIAYEKAGIMKKGVCITGASGAALAVVKEEAGKRNIPLRVQGEDFFVDVVEADNTHTVFNYIGSEFYKRLEVRLLGRYQANNAALAVAAAEELGIGKEAIRKGLRNAKNPGRLQIIEKKPLIVIDAAHNPDGIRELVKNLDLFDYEKLICVFGVMKEKNWKEMLMMLVQHCDLLMVNQPKIERAADAEEVAKEASAYTKTAVIKDVKKSLAYAKKQAKKKDMILVCGSIYMLGELL